MTYWLINYPNRLRGCDKKSTRIEELISSIKEIKYAAMTIEPNSSNRINEFHHRISQLQIQTQKIEQAVKGVYESNNLKKDEKD